MSEKKRNMVRLDVNLNIWVKQNERRKDHGWEKLVLQYSYLSFLWRYLDKKDGNFQGMSLFMSILLWNVKFLPKCIPIKNSGVFFLIMKIILKSFFFTQGHCILVILIVKATFFKPPFSWPLQGVLCSIFLSLPCQMNFFCILYEWSIIIKFSN